MAIMDAFDRVTKFLQEIKEIPQSKFDQRLQEIEQDIFELFKRLEKVHAISSQFQGIDLSEDVYSLLRMIKDRKKVVRTFPLLSRAAGLF